MVQFVRQLETVFGYVSSRLVLNISYLSRLATVRVELVEVLYCIVLYFLGATGVLCYSLDITYVFTRGDPQAPSASFVAESTRAVSELPSQLP